MSEFSQPNLATAPAADAQPAVVFVEKPKNGLGTAALVLGILAIVFAILPFLNVISYVLAFVAIGLGIAGIVRANKVKVGMVKTIIGVALAALSLGVATMVNAATVTAIDDTLTAIDQELDATDEISATFGDVTTEYGMSQVPVTITNTSAETQTYFVTVVAESADGTQQYDTTYVSASDLKPGQSTTVTAQFTTELPSDAELLVSDAF